MFNLKQKHILKVTLYLAPPSLKFSQTLARLPAPRGLESASYATESEIIAIDQSISYQSFDFNLELSHFKSSILSINEMTLNCLALPLTSLSLI